MKNTKYKILTLFLSLSLFLSSGINLVLAVGEPTITTDSATSITKTTATLNASVNSAGSSDTTVAGFEYGLTDSYGSTVSSANVNDLSYVSQFGSNGSGDGQFNLPKGIAVDLSGNIYVADTNNHRIQKFNSAGVYQSQIGSSGSGNGQFSYPTDVAIDSSGNIFVSDTNNNRIQKFNSSGVYQSKFSITGVASYLAFDSSGNIFVSDTNNNRIQKFNSSGVFQTQFGTYGSSNTQFNLPRGIAIDASDNIYVADTSNQRVQKFNSSGVYQSQFSVSGYPYDIEIDSQGKIFTISLQTPQLKKFNSSGVQEKTFGTNGSGDGQFGGPFGIAVNKTNNSVYISDYNNNRVQKIQEVNPAVSEGIESLTCGTTYHYRAFLTNSNGTGYGSDATFTTSACQVSSVSSGSVSAYSATTATLDGNITSLNSSGNVTVRGFEYGLTDSYGSTTTENGSFGTGAYTADLTDLTSCTTYHYRAYNTNTAGTSYGADNTFTTFCSPTVTTGTPKFLSSTSERLKGNITDTGGENATVRGFQYGSTTDYGITTTNSGSYGTGTFSTDITGLANGATYHYRAYATNGVGTSYGSDQTFTVGSSTSISSCAEFEAIGTNTDTLDGAYSLTTNLDCTSEGNDIMVAVNGDPFTGTFDGNGHTMTVAINTGNSNRGLFGRANGAIITDLNIAGSVIGTSDLGSLIGYAQNTSDGSTHPVLTITNVHSTANVTGSGGYVGGLIGEIYNQGVGEVGDTTAINISNSSFTGNVSGSYYVGGLVGYIDQESSSSVSIVDSYVVGDISGTDNEVGGLVGEWDQYDGDVVMTGNHYSGNITSTSSYVGGLVGYMYSDVGGGYEERTVTISDNYTTGSVSGSEDVGGMFGYSEFYIDQSFPLTVNIENNYSTADVTSGYGDAGGLFGYLYTYSYYTDYPLNITLSENYATGTITSTIENEYGDVGGLVGRLEINSDYISVVLSKSYFSGDIVTAGNYVGGLVGDLQNVGDTSMAINDSYASADITAYDGLGGLVGYVYANNGADLNVNRSYAIGTVNGSDVNNSGEGGGLIGVINGGLNITDSFSAALVQAFDYGYGAVVGYANNPFTTINVYFDQTTAGGIECADNDTIEGCTPVNTNETPNTTYFKSNHTNTPMDEWNFETIWTNIADENNNYPVLRAFHPVSTPTVTTSLATSTTQTTTTLNGEITATGGESNTVRGFEYGTTISYGSSVYDTGTYSTGTYSINLNGLVCGTTYYYRAYSTNSAGNGNGINDTFTTSNCSSGGGPVDLIVLQQMSDNLRNQTTPTNTQTNTNNTNTNTNNTNTKFIFTKNLKYKMKDNQVLELQKYLNNNGYPISLTGIGSLGNETNYFGKATQSALAKFQKANRIKPAIGYFGPVTRARVNR